MSEDKFGVKDFKFTVTVSAETQEQAEIVMTERINFDENYGFEYDIKWEK